MGQNIYTVFFTCFLHIFLYNMDMKFARFQRQISVADFRRNMATYFKRADKKPLFLSGGRSGETKVILSVDLYNKFLGAYENMQDSLELQKLVEKDDGSRVSLEELKRKYEL